MTCFTLVFSGFRYKMASWRSIGEIIKIDEEWNTISIIIVSFCRYTAKHHLPFFYHQQKKKASSATLSSFRVWTPALSLTHTYILCQSKAIRERRKKEERSEERSIVSSALLCRKNGSTSVVAESTLPCI